MSRRTTRLLTAVLAVVVVTACGKRGNPLPPLRPVAARILDLAAVRTDDTIELSFTVPATNLDGSTPVAIDRVEIYAVSGPPLPPPPPPVAPVATVTPPGTPPATPPVTPPVTPPAPPAAPPVADPAAAAAAAAAAAKQTPAQRAAAIAATLPPTGAMVADPKNLIGRVVIRPPAAPVVAEGEAKPVSAAPAPAAPAPPDTRPGTGERATFVDTLDPAKLTGMGMRYYIAVGVVGTGRGRSGPISGLVSVPLVPAPATPESLTATFDETTITVSWAVQPTVPAVNLYETDPASPSAPPKLLTPKPIPGPTFEAPAEFGRARCFIARTAGVIGPATLLGPPSEPACVTPVDRFPPPGVSGLQVVQEGAAVTLVWTAVDARDLAGYLVLRVESPGDTLQPLTKAIVTGATYRDETARVGATYVYAIVAVDKAGNQGPPSDRQTVTIR